MADAVPLPISDAEAKLFRDSEEALKRSRELLAEIETLLAFQHYRPATWIEGSSRVSDPDLVGRDLERPRRCGKPS